MAIAVSLSFLLLLSVIGASGLRTSMQESRMANNYKDRLAALAAAEAALNDAGKQLRESELYGEGASIMDSDGNKRRISFTVNCQHGYCRRDASTGKLPWEQAANWDRAIPYATDYGAVARQPEFLLEFLSFTNSTAFESKTMHGLKPIYHATIPAWGYQASVVYPVRQFATDSIWRFAFYDPWNSAADNHKAIFRIINAWQTSTTNPAVNKDPVTGEVIYTYDYRDILNHSPGKYTSGLSARAPLSVDFYADNGKPTGPATFDPLYPNVWCQYQLALNAWLTCNHNGRLSDFDPRIPELNFEYAWYHHMGRYPFRTFWANCAWNTENDALSVCPHTGFGGSEPTIGAKTTASSTVLAPPWDLGISYVGWEAQPQLARLPDGVHHAADRRTKARDGRVFHHKAFTGHCALPRLGDTFNSRVLGCGNVYHVDDLEYYYGNTLTCRQTTDKATAFSDDFKKICFACDLRESDADGGNCLHHYSCIQSAPNHMQWQPQDLIRKGTQSTSTTFANECFCQMSVSGNRIYLAQSEGAQSNGACAPNGAEGAQDSDDHYLSGTVSYVDSTGNPRSSVVNKSTDSAGTQLESDDEGNPGIAVPLEDHGASGLLQCQARSQEETENARTGTPVFGGDYSCEPGWRIGYFVENEPVNPLSRTEQLRDEIPSRETTNPLCDFTLNCQGNVTLGIPGNFVDPVVLPSHVTYTNFYRATAQGYGLQESTKAQMQMLAWLRTLQIGGSDGTQDPLPTCGDVEVSPGKRINFSELSGDNGAVPTQNWQLGNIRVYNSALRPLIIPKANTDMEDLNTYEGNQLLSSERAAPGGIPEWQRYFWVRDKGGYFKYVRKYKYLQPLGKTCTFLRRPPLTIARAPVPEFKPVINCTDAANSLPIVRHKAIWYYYDTPTGEPYDPVSDTPRLTSDHSAQPITIDLRTNHRQIYDLMHTDDIVLDGNGNVTSNGSLFSDNGDAVINLVQPTAPWTDAGGATRQACSPYLGQRNTADRAGNIPEVGDSFIRRWPPNPASQFGVSGARSEIRRR